MRAIILNSGEGKRLLPLTQLTPKALLKIGEKPVLAYQLDALVKCGIKKIIITTGRLHQTIQEYVSKNYPHLDIIYVKNPKYDSTNYIYSLWLTKGLIDEDIVLTHGDLLFEDSILEEIIKQTSSHVLVDKNIEPPEKDFKALISNERIIKIGVNLKGQNVYFCAPLYKLQKQDFETWLDEIERQIKNGKTDIYAENAFNVISDKIKLYPHYYTGKCLEIDTIEDLKTANSLFSMKKNGTQI